LAAVGWPAAELFDKKIAAANNLPALLDANDRVPSVLNGGLAKVPPAFWAVTLGIAFAIECLGKAKEDSARRAGGKLTPGDLGFDPFNYKALTYEGRFYEAEAELFNGRLAMLGIAGFVFQEVMTKQGVVDETPFFFHNPF
jgi:light-harvesting complex I chlorophyll a/b binding protein 1